MKRSIFLLVLGSFLLAFALAACTASATPVPATESPAPGSTNPPAASGSPSFANDVLPILQNRCFSCHSGNSARAGVQLDSYTALMAGSPLGTLVVPGNPANSLLVQVIQGGIMPKSGGKVPADELQVIIDWIKAGAPEQ